MLRRNKERFKVLKDRKPSYFQGRNHQDQDLALSQGGFAVSKDAITGIERKDHSIFAE